MAKKTLTIDDEVKKTSKQDTQPKNTQPKTTQPAYDIKKTQDLFNKFNDTYAKVQEERSKPVDSYAKAYEDSLGSTKATVSDKKTDQKVVDRAKDIKVNTWGEDIHNHSQDGFFVRAKENYDEMYRRQHNGQTANEKHEQIKDWIAEGQKQLDDTEVQSYLDSDWKGLFGTNKTSDTLKELEGSNNVQRAIVHYDLANDYELAQRNIQNMDEETRNSFNNILDYAIKADDADTFKKVVDWAASYNYGGEGDDDLAGGLRRINATLGTTGHNIAAGAVKMGSSLIDRLNTTYRGFADMLYDMGVISEGSYNAIQIPDYDIMSDDRLAVQMQKEIEYATALTQNNLNAIQKFALDATGSTAQFLMETAAFGPTAALYFMSGQSAADKYYDNLAAGYDEDTALGNAIATGMVSYIVEKIGMDRFVEMMAGKGGDYIMGNLIHNLKTNATRAGVSEGLEEVVEALIDGVVDNATLGTPIEYQPGQLFVSFLLGGVSGLALGTYAAVRYTISTSEQAKAMRSEIETIENGLKNGTYGQPGSEEYVRAENTIKMGNDALANFNEQSILSEAINKVEPEAEALSPSEAVKEAHDSMIPTAEKMMQTSEQTMDAVKSLNDNITRALEMNNIVDTSADQWMKMSAEQRTNAKALAEQAGNAGIKLKIDPTLTEKVNGRMLNSNTMVINPNSKQSYNIIAAHELVHSLLRKNANGDFVVTKEYESLFKLVYNNFSQIAQENDGSFGDYRGYTWKELTDNIKEEYAKPVKDEEDNIIMEGTILSDFEANDEALAYICQTLFGSDSNLLDKIATNKSGLFRKLWNSIETTMSGRLSGTIAEQVENRFIEAFQNRDSGHIADPQYEDARASILPSVKDTSGNEYKNVILLDRTDLSTLSFKERGEFIKAFVMDELAGSQFIVTDSNGNIKILEIADKKLRARKGSGKKTPVIRKLSNYYNKDILRGISIIHIDEIASVADVKNWSSKSTHGNFDANGWDSGNATIADSKGNLYEAILNIAKTKDGRNIIYNIATKDLHKKAGSGQIVTTPPASSRSVTDSRGSINPNADYIKAVESGDMETAQKLVDEAASRSMPNTKLHGYWYHGTENEFTVFNFSQGGKNGTGEGFGIYLTDNPNVSQSYGDRQIKSFVNMERPATSDRLTLTNEELFNLIKATVDYEAEETLDEYEDLEEAKLNSWISNYTNTYLANSIDEAINDVAETIRSMNSSDMNAIQEIMTGMGIYDYDDAIKFYDLLTETTGIDGFVTEWSHSNNPKIALAFRSSQIKSADPITYDDNGNVIPLSQRFNERNDDIRYSRNPSVTAQEETDGSINPTTNTETEIEEPLTVEDEVINSLLTGNNKDMAAIDRQKQYLIDTAPKWIPNYEQIHKNYPQVRESSLSNALFDVLAYGELSDDSRESLKRDFVFGSEYEGVDQDLKDFLIDDALQDITGTSLEQAEHIADVVDGFVNDAVEFFAADEAYKANKNEYNKIANKANMFAKAEGVRTTAPYEVYADVAREGLEKLTESEKRIAEQKADEILENTEAITNMMEGGRNYQTRFKTLEQVLDVVANKNRQLREMLKNGLQLKRDLAYTRNADIRDQYAKELKKILDLGIKTNTNEARAVTWLIEGHTKEAIERADGKLEWKPFTEADLKEQFNYKMKNGRMAWENIQKAADIARNTFAELGNQINDGLSQIYLEDDITRLYEKEKIAAQIKVQKELVSRLENELRVNPTAELQAAYNRAQTELKTWQARLNAKIDMEEKGDDVRRRKLLIRNNYVHHSAMKTNFGQRLWHAITDNGYNVPTALAGISQYVQPKSTFDTILLEQSVQPGGNYNDDIMMNLKDYIEKASYKIAFDPVIASYRNFTNNLKALDTNNQFGAFQNYMVEYTNQLAGKSNELDRVFRDTAAGNAAQRAWNVFRVMNAQAKTAAVVGNIRSAVVQFANIGNGMGVVKMNGGTNTDIANGIHAWMQSYNEGALHNQSAFMRNRYGDIDIGESEFTLNNVANRIMEFGDEIVARQLWYIGYEMGTRQGVDDPMLFADDIVRRSIGGRYKGEYAPIMTNQFINALAPFQLETNNAWQTLKQAVGDGNWQAVLYMMLTNAAMGAIFKELFGDKVVLDPIDDIIEGIQDGKDVNEKITKAVGYTVGDLISNIPYSSIITAFAGIGDDPYGKWEKIFGDNSPNRYGIGTLGVSGIVDFLQDKTAMGALELVADYIPGGNQLMKTGKSAYYYSKGVYTTKKGKIGFAVDEDPINTLKAMLFGIWSTDAGQQYLDGGNVLSDKQTNVFDYLASSDVKGQDAYKIADEITSSDKRTDIIDTLNNADYLTDEQRNEIYDMYTDTKTNDRLNDFAEAYGLTFEQEYTIKTAQSIEKDANQSAAEKRLEVYEEQGIMDELIKYVEENDLNYGDVGLNKTVVKDYLDSYEQVMNGSKSDSQSNKNKKRRTTRKSSKKTVKNPVDEFRASLLKDQADSLNNILSEEVWNKTEKQIQANIQKIRQKYMKNGLYNLIQRYLKNHPEADPKQFGL